MQYLMTQSLLASWSYVFKAYDPDEAMADFLRVLNRERGEQTDAMLAGIEFESAVYRFANGDPRYLETSPSCLKWDNGIKAVAEHLVGAQFQVRVKRDITVGDMDFLCYGVLDGLKAGVISDVKYKVKSFGSVNFAGSYTDSAQHPMYFYLVPEAYEFQYLVSDGQDLYREVYRPDECRFIGDIIAEFIQSITEMGLLELYKEKWAAL